MSKEQQELLDEAYNNYINNFIPPTCPYYLDVQPGYYDPMSKDWFIESIKEKGLRGEEFSKKWDLVIEERELNLDERAKLHPNPENFYEIHGTFSISDSIEDSNFPYKDWLHEQFDNSGIPTKQITLTYKDKTIESYE